jgi:tetrapyrrole methylase family protein/MazG family protein
VIHLVGLGPGDPASLRPQAFALLARRDLPLFLRTRRHPTLDDEPVRGALAGRDNLVSFDDEYERHTAFDVTYEAIVARVLEAAERHGEIVYAVPGHPLIGETTVARLLPRAKAAGVATRVVGAPSFVDACLEAVGETITGDLLVLDALALEPNAPTAHPALRTPGAPVLLYQVHDRQAASTVKLALMRAGYPDDFVVTVLRAAGVPGEEAILPTPLFALDRGEAAARCDHLSSVWVPPLLAADAAARPPGLDGLVRVMARLRDPDNGCPWDREQTHASLRPYVIEEAYEVAEAIDQDDPDKLCDELGDLLLQVVFHAQLAAEEGVWDIEDVCAVIVAKLVRRHPHVFGNVKVDGADEVLMNWNAIKAAEKGNKQWESVLDGIPTSLPALARALQVSRRAVKAGFEWPDTTAVLAKVDEELAELRAEIARNAPPNQVAGELGDLLFTLVNVARRLDLDPEEALRGQMKRFEYRFRHIEQRARERGVPLESLTLSEMEDFWQEAKQKEKNDED